MHTQLVHPAKQPAILPVALCIFRYQHSLLVREVVSGDGEQPMYSLPGGIVVFGEYSWETVRREMRDTFAQEIKNLMFLGPTEQVVQQADGASHEIIFMFEAEFVNREVYRHAELAGKTPKGEIYRTTWQPISLFKRKRARLYPEGLLEMLVE